MRIVSYDGLMGMTVHNKASFSRRLVDGTIKLRKDLESSVQGPVADTVCVIGMTAFLSAEHVLHRNIRIPQ
ncbi:MAG: hypothetical protein ACJA0Z_002708 [Halioglobus sp.]|jgi:hypothetical protein